MSSSSSFNWYGQQSNGTPIQINQQPVSQISIMDMNTSAQQNSVLSPALEPAHLVNTTGWTDPALERSFTNQTSSSSLSEGAKIQGDKLESRTRLSAENWNTNQLADASNLSTKVHGDALLGGGKPATLTDNKDWNSGSQLGENWDKVDLLFKREVPREIIELEEQERAERMKKGVSPVLLGKYHQIHRELMHYQPSFASTLSSIPSVVSSIPAVVKETTSSLSSKTAGLTERTLGAISSFEHKVLDSTKSYYEMAKDALGLNPSSIANINKEEEKERARRMAEGVDPVMEGRRRRIEDELLQTVKPF